MRKFHGKKHSEESKKLMSLKQKEKWVRLRANPEAYKSFIEKTSKASKANTVFKLRGDKHPGWKGGVRTSKRDGYVYIWKPDHPNAVSRGYVLEHRLVMEKVLGRYLKPDEDVNHINGNKGDNRPENLTVVRHYAHYQEMKCPKCEFTFRTR
jgi:hypothetical protein